MEYGFGRDKRRDVFLRFPSKLTPENNCKGLFICLGGNPERDPRCPLCGTNMGNDELTIHHDSCETCFHTMCLSALLYSSDNSHSSPKHCPMCQEQLVLYTGVEADIHRELTFEDIRMASRILPDFTANIHLTYRIRMAYVRKFLERIYLHNGTRVDPAGNGPGYHLHRTAQQIEGLILNVIIGFTSDAALKAYFQREMYGHDDTAQTQTQTQALPEAHPALEHNPFMALGDAPADDGDDDGSIT